MEYLMNSEHFLSYSGSLWKSILMCR
jgi:hypothetical protein